MIHKIESKEKIEKCLGSSSLGIRWGTGCSSISSSYFSKVFLYMPFGMRPKGPFTTAYAYRNRERDRLAYATGVFYPLFWGCLRVEHQVDAERG